VKLNFSLLILFFLQSSWNLASYENQLKSYDAIVGHQSSHTIPVYSKIQHALDAAPQHSTTPYRIYIAQGTYAEKLLVTKNNVQLIGANKENTHIRFDDYSGRPDGKGKTSGTGGSATVRISAKDIHIENITLENNFDFLTNDQLSNDNPARIKDPQAVALFIDAPSDRTLVRNVALLGNQDTLFVNSGRSWFDKVYIEGNIDFIFGQGNALFTKSEIKTLARGKSINPHGFITAPSTQIASEYGLTFLNCRLTREESVPDNSVALGRPWHPTRDFADGRYADPNAIGKAVFINTWMGAHIMNDGWHSMNGMQKDGGSKTFLPEDSRFIEYKSIGPGANAHNKRRELKDNEITLYNKNKILGDWQPNEL